MPQSIAILAPSSVPFQIGGAEKLWLGLYSSLSSLTSCPVELIKIPSHESTFHEIIASYKLFSQLDLSHFDVVITTKYPAWMVHHNNHIVYMQHTLRGLYDTYHCTHLPETLTEVPRALRDLVDLIRTEKPKRDDLSLAFDLIDRAFAAKTLPQSLFSFPGPLLREIVHFFDRIALSQDAIKAYAAISKNVAKRKDYFPKGVEAHIIYHPSDITQFFQGKGDFVFTASRLNKTKRVDLIVSAMHSIHSKISLKIAGTGPELDNLENLALGDPRIEFLGFVRDEERAKLYANAICVPFVPYDEDYGLITIEAMKSGKPVVTTKDSGGVLEFVENGVTGLVTDPTPQALGCAVQSLLDNPSWAEEMGANAKKRVAAISWENTIPKLLSLTKQTKPSPVQKILVLSTYPIRFPMRGGQQRLFHICKTLSHFATIVVIAFGSQYQKGSIHNTILPNVQQTILPWSKMALTLADKLQKKVQVSVDDLALMHCCKEDPLLLETIQAHADALSIIVSQPYLYPAIKKALPNTPCFYDAHNVETKLKAQILQENAPEILFEIQSIEKECVCVAQKVFVCSKEDCDYFIKICQCSEDHFILAPNGCESTLLCTNAKERKKNRKHLYFPKAHLALFIGSEHKPNTEAVFHIIAMAKQTPCVEFLIAGSVSVQESVANATLPCNVHLLGLISDKEKEILLRSADIGLNPITSGSGTNLKILEYIATGMEVVTTPFGMRGIDLPLTDSVHCVALSDFPKTLTRIANHPCQDAAREKNAKTIIDQYSWDATLKNVYEFYEQRRRRDS